MTSRPPFNRDARRAPGEREHVFGLFEVPNTEKLHAQVARGPSCVDTQMTHDDFIKLIDLRFKRLSDSFNKSFNNAMVKDKFDIADEKGENFTEEDFNEKGFNANNNVTEVSKSSDLQNKFQSKDLSQFFNDLANKVFEYAFKVKSKDTVNIFGMHAKEKEKENENTKEKEKGFYVSIDESNFKTKVWIV
jgi:hypothetical protein